jgi:hypothetical protein
MSWVRIKEDGTKVTTPTWAVIPCWLIGTASPLALIWVLLFEAGSRRWAFVIAILCLAAVAIRALVMCEKHEHADRSTFGRAKFTGGRSEAGRAGLSGD